MHLVHGFMGMHFVLGLFNCVHVGRKRREIEGGELVYSCDSWEMVLGSVQFLFFAVVIFQIEDTSSIFLFFYVYMYTHIMCTYADVLLF